MMGFNTSGNTMCVAIYCIAATVATANNQRQGWREDGTVQAIYDCDNLYVMPAGPAGGACPGQGFMFKI